MGSNDAVRFSETFCSQCGGQFGPGNHGYSHCSSHMILARKHWMEREEPFDLDGDEMIEFLSEYCTGHEHKESEGKFVISSFWFKPISGRTLGEAIHSAAEKYKEINS